MKVTIKFKEVEKGDHTHVRFTYPGDRKRVMVREVHEITYPNEENNAESIEYLIEDKKD